MHPTHTRWPSPPKGMPSHGPSNQPRTSRLPSAECNATKKEQQRKLRLHLLAIQQEQKNLGRPRRSTHLQVKVLNQQWWNNGWPADFPYTVAILCGEEGYLEEGVDFKPNQSVAAEAKTGGIRTQWGVSNFYGHYCALTTSTQLSFHHHQLHAHQQADQDQHSSPSAQCNFPETNAERTSLLHHRAAQTGYVTHQQV